MVFPDFQPMKVSVESVYIFIFRQNTVFTSLNLRFSVHVVPPLVSGLQLTVLQLSGCWNQRQKSPVPEFIDPRFRENKPKTLVFNHRKQRFGLVFAKTGSIISGTVPEFIDPVFTKTSPKRSFSLNRKRAFWLVFAKTGSIISGTDHFQVLCLILPIAIPMGTAPMN